VICRDHMCFILKEVEGSDRQPLDLRPTLLLCGAPK